MKLNRFLSTKCFIYCQRCLAIFVHCLVGWQRRQGLTLELPAQMSSCTKWPALFAGIVIASVAGVWSTIWAWRIRFRSRASSHIFDTYLHHTAYDMVTRTGHFASPPIHARRVYLHGIQQILLALHNPDKALEWGLIEEWSPTSN